MIICHICNNTSDFAFKTKVLRKHEVSYFKCKNCGFIQTEPPYWLNEAYEAAISELDIGLVQRNIDLSSFTATFIKNKLKLKGKFIDYAGGYGLFVRLMRDKGFDYYRQDDFCANIFAVNFDITDINTVDKFEILTAFEVFEHLEFPYENLKKMLSLSDSILFSTELIPNSDIKTSNDWWYFVPESGQHISFYSKKSLEIMAKHFNCTYFTNNKNLHLITRKKIKNDPFIESTTERFTTKLLDKIVLIKDGPPLQSLLQDDYEFVKSKKTG